MEFLKIALTFAMDDLHVKTKELANASDSGIKGRGVF